MQSKIYMTGGGSNEDELPITLSFLENITNPNILYIPIALNPESDNFKNSHTWINDRFKSANPNKTINITTIKNIDNIPNKDWGGIFVGGGNTFRLMDLLKQSGLDKIIIELISKGVPFIGGSAGALICGEYIHLANDPPIGPTDYKGLNLAKGLSCCCHYTNKREQEVKDYIAEHDRKIICLSETAGALITDDKITSCGKTPAYLYTKDGVEEL